MKVDSLTPADQKVSLERLKEFVFHLEKMNMFWQP